MYPTVILNLIRSASCVSYGDSKFLSFGQLCIPRWPVRGFGLIARVSHGDSKLNSFSQLCIPRWPVRGFGLIICEYRGESEFSFIYVWYCFIICTHIEFWLPFHATCGNQLSELIIWYLQMNIINLLHFIYLDTLWIYDYIMLILKLWPNTANTEYNC